MLYEIDRDYGQIASTSTYQIIECGGDRFLTNEMSAMAVQIKDWKSEKHRMVWEETDRVTSYTSNKIRVKNFYSKFIDQICSRNIQRKRIDNLGRKRRYKTVECSRNGFNERLYDFIK